MPPKRKELPEVRVPHKPANNATMSHVLEVLAKLERWFRAGEPDELPDGEIDDVRAQAQSILGWEHDA